MPADAPNHPLVRPEAVIYLSEAQTSPKAERYNQKLWIGEKEKGGVSLG
jgi:hypothetical protein